MAPRSVTTWSRLETRTRDRELHDGLRAAVHDPLWLLGRQWQTGELAGEDGGSPVDVSVDVTVDPISRFRPGSAAGPDGDTVYDEDHTAHPPLESLVERERVRPTGSDVDTDASDERNIRLAAEAGSHFLRLLGDAFDLSVEDFPSSLHCEETDADDTGRRYSSVVAGRVLDGDAVREAYEFDDESAFRAALTDDERDVPVPDAVVPSEFDPDGDGGDDDDANVFWDAFSTYREWYDDLYAEPGADETSWRDDRLEYDFEIATGGGDRETVFTADYEGGRLDWDDFDVVHDGTLEPANADGPESHERHVERIPTPSRFKGMPAYRWWEIEDDGVNFSAIEAAPEDLSRLLMLEFGLVYGNDWFTLPIDQPIGSVAEITDLTVTNTFGDTVTIEDAVDADDDPTTDWNAYSVPLSADGDDRGLLLPPVLVSTLESQRVEDVTFGRDEIANVGWAIERTVEGTAGQPRDRQTEIATAGSDSSRPVTTSEQTDLAYQLSTDVPENWFPLLPRQTDLETVTLDRGRVLTDGDDLPEPNGRVLRGDLSIPEEEIPRRGKSVSRTYQHTRWIDGSSHLWSGRSTRVSRGRTDSGLAFDQLVDPRLGEDDGSAVDVDSMPEGEAMSKTGELVVAGVSPTTPGGPRENLTAEFVAFENAGGGRLDLSGWQVADDAGHSYEFPAGAELAPGGRLTCRTGDGEDGNGQYYWGRNSQVWNDDGDVVTVTDDAGEVVLTYEYPERPDAVRTGSLRLADVQADAPGNDWEHLSEEYLIFENDAEESLDLSGWQVADDAGHEYVFPLGTVIGPGETITLRTGDGTDTDTDVYWGSGAPIWNNTGDVVSVFDSDGELVLRESY